MGLIINREVRKLIVGFPTVSDKYNVEGGTVETAAVKPGDLVTYGSQVGMYKSAAGIAAITAIAGVVLATNVKTPMSFPDADQSFAVGEALNVLRDGYIAIKLDDDATVAGIVAGAKPAIILATGKLTTADKITTGVVSVTNMKFTGIHEDIVAEVEVIRA